jgi:hypothetical protein
VVGPKQEFDGEARRIAAELVRLHEDGAIASQADAADFARLLRDFGATYTGPAQGLSETAKPICADCYAARPRPSRAHHGRTAALSAEGSRRMAGLKDTSREGTDVGYGYD